MKHKTQTTILTIAAALVSLGADFSIQEKHRLGAYLSLVTAGHEKIYAPDDGNKEEYIVGSTCPNCDGRAVLGDGKVEFPCEWREGEFYCYNGKIAKSGSMKEAEEIEQSLEGITDYGLDLFAESYTDQCEGESCQQEEGDEEEQPALPLKTSEVERARGPSWNVEGRTRYTRSFLVEHLREDHSFVDTDRYSLENLKIIHDNFHNTGKPFIEESFSSSQAQNKKQEVSSSSSSSCPSGNCPVSSSGSSRSTSSSRRGLFRRR